MIYVTKRTPLSIAALKTFKQCDGNINCRIFFAQVHTTRYFFIKRHSSRYVFLVFFPYFLQSLSFQDISDLLHFMVNWHKNSL